VQVHAPSVPVLPAPPRPSPLGSIAHHSTLRELEQKTMNETPTMFAQNDAPLSVHSRAKLPDHQPPKNGPGCLRSSLLQCAELGFAPGTARGRRSLKAQWR